MPVSLFPFIPNQNAFVLYGPHQSLMHVMINLFRAKVWMMKHILMRYLMRCRMRLLLRHSHLGLLSVQLADAVAMQGHCSPLSPGTQTIRLGLGSSGLCLRDTGTLLRFVLLVRLFQESRFEVNYYYKKIEISYRADSPPIGTQHLRVRDAMPLSGHGSDARARPCHGCRFQV